MTLRKNWRQLLTVGLFVSASGLALAQIPQGLSAQGMQLPQALQGAGGLIGGGVGGAGGSLGLGAPSGIRSADPLPSQQGGSVLFQPMEPLKPNDFQKFVLETTGYKLPLYGSAFFENLQFIQRSQLTNQPGPTPFAPVETAPVSPDYPIGPGDQVLIRE